MLIKKLAAIFLLAFLLSQSTLLADALSRKNARANRFYKEGKYDEAAKLYLDAQLEAPKSSQLHHNLGNADYKLKKYEKAVECFQKAAQSKDPKIEQQAQFNLGNALYKLGEQEVQSGKQEGLDQMTKAIEAYKRALDLNPDDRDAKYNLEFVRRKLKEMSKREPQQQQNQKQQQQQQQQKQEQQKQQKPDSTQSQPQRKPGEMTPEEAKRLLDAYKDSEKDAKKKQEVRVRGNAGVEKDW